MTKTIVYAGKHYPPGKEFSFPETIVDEIIDKNAGEPVLQVESFKDLQNPAPDKDHGQKEIDLSKSDPMDDYIIAAEQAVKAGLVTATGAPEVKAMEDILGCNITAEDRDAAWAAMKVGAD